MSDLSKEQKKKARKSLLDRFGKEDDPRLERIKKQIAKSKGMKKKAFGQ